MGPQEVLGRIYLRTDLRHGRLVILSRAGFLQGPQRIDLDTSLAWSFQAIGTANQERRSASVRMSKVPAEGVFHRIASIGTSDSRGRSSECWMWEDDSIHACRIF